MATRVSTASSRATTLVASGAIPPIARWAPPRPPSLPFTRTRDVSAPLGALRAARIGVVFRRQLVIAGFIVDFAAPEARLAVEVDGGYQCWPREVGRSPR